LHSRTVPAHLRLITRHALLTYALKHWKTWQVRVLGGIVRLEALLRGWWAVRRGDETAASIFTALRNLTTDLTQGNTAAARHKLIDIVREQEKNFAAFALDRHSQL